MGTDLFDVAFVRQVLQMESMLFKQGDFLGGTLVGADYEVFDRGRSKTLSNAQDIVNPLVDRFLQGT